ncbi:MAG: pro-sigmaK processing inhibitor BofA family protein [Ruminococcus sp.]|nr:pro-sigmaK processing inhibitor BofA family protein [Ruminococcus sp.]
MRTETLFYIICGTAFIAMLLYYIKRRHKVISFIFGSLSGLVTLFLFNKFGYVAGLEIPLNIFNICGSAVLGIPFVAVIIIINFL